MKNGLYLFFVALVLAGCSKISVDEKISIDWEQLHPSTIKSQLDRMDIIADQKLVDEMMVSPYVDIEVPAHIDYYSENGELILQESGVIEIKGTGSVSEDMKPIGIKFNNRVNNEQLGILVPSIMNANHSLDNLSSIRLRNSGQDYGVTMIKDLAYSEFAVRSGLDVEVKYGNPIHVFINQKYYGMHNLRSENDPFALADLFHSKPENITMIKMDHKNGKLEYKSGDQALAASLIEAIQNEDIWGLRELVDVDNFIDYIIFEDYIGNMDWPHNNVRMYSNNGEPFRFSLYDLDYAAYRAKEHVLPEMEFKDDYMSRMLQVFLEFDHDFEETLLDRQEDWYEVFSTERFDAIVDELARKIEGEMKYLIARRRSPGSTLQWRINLEQLKRDFERADHYSRKKYQLN